jgi:adenylate cyclase
MKEKPDKTTKKFDKSVFLSILGLVLIIFLTWLFFLKDILLDIETITYDWRARIATEQNPLGLKLSQHDRNIILLAANDDTNKILEKYPEINPGRWPWSRKLWGDVVNFVNMGNPKAIVFDLKFEGSEKSFDKNFNPDKYFADSIKNKNVTIATALLFPRSSEKVSKMFKLVDQELIKQNYKLENLPNKYADKYISDIYSRFYKRNFFKDSVALLPDSDYYIDLPYINKDGKNFMDNITFYDSSTIFNKLKENTNYMGVINLSRSENVVFRNHTPLYRLVNNQGNLYVPSLPFAAVLSVLSKNEKKPFIIEKNKIIIGTRHIPIDDEGNLLLNWHGSPQTYQTIALGKVLISEAYQKGAVKSINKVDLISPEFFRDKIVVIGQTTAGTDIHPTPMSSVYPGPEIITTAIDNLLNDTDLKNPLRRKFIKKSSPVNNILLCLVLCLIIGYVMIRAKSNRVKFQTFVLAFLLFITLAVCAFVHPQVRIWINITYPIVFMSLTGIGTYAYITYLENKERKEVENLFGKFVSPQVLRKLLLDKSSFSREGQRKIMTVLFSDIRGFTTLSEKNPPDLVIEILNEYITEMVEVILSYNGTLDKYIGDAIMAFYNDPVDLEDHALRSVLTAIAMKKKLAELNEKWQKQGKPVLNIGIGINTGEMIVGHLGSPRLVDYTVIGDNVNLASRVEGLTKNYNTNILITEYTYQDVKDYVLTEFKDEVTVKGKEKPVKIYSVLDIKSDQKKPLAIIKEANTIIAETALSYTR